MNIEIWNKTDSSYTRSIGVEISSVSDVSTCELVFLHLSSGSMPSLSQTLGEPPKTGDVFVLFDDETDKTGRAYELETSEDCCGTPKFKRIRFDHT